MTLVGCRTGQKFEAWSRTKRKFSVYHMIFVLHRGPESILGTNEAKGGKINDVYLYDRDISKNFDLLK